MGDGYRNGEGKGEAGKLKELFLENSKAYRLSLSSLVPHEAGN